MKLIHMSDIHLTAPGTTVGGRDPRKNFKRALAHVLRDHRDAELMVITGDLSDCGDRNDYRWLKARLDAFPIPVRLCIGDHNDRAAFLDVFRASRPRTALSRACTTHQRRVACSSTRRSENPRRPLLRRPSRLARRTAGRTRRGVPAVHAPQSDADPFAAVDEIGLLDGAEFCSWWHAEHRIRHIFFGHCHLPLAGSVAGVPISSPRGTNHASYPLFSETKLSAVADLPNPMASCSSAATKSPFTWWSSATPADPL